MIQMQLISSVIEVERKLAFEEESLVNHRFEPYVNYLAAPRCMRQKRSGDIVDPAPADIIKALNSIL